MVNAFKTFPHLLSPIKVGNVVFRNRMFCSPTGHTDIVESGQLSVDAVSYFERKAIGGCASIIDGEVNVDPEAMSDNYSWPRSITKPGNYNYPRLASAGARHGAVPVLELQFEGMNARFRARDPELKKKMPWAPVDMFDENGVQTHRAMTEERYAEVIEGYGKAALAAKKAGFRMVSLHGAHGWGLQQWMSPFVNTSTGKWGGNPEGRCRFAVMAIDEIHRVCGKDFPVEIRISGTEVTPDGYGVDEACRIAEQLDGHADIIHVSVGGCKHSDESGARTHVSMFYPEGRNVEYAAEIKKHVKKSYVATIGGLSDPYTMEKILAEGKADIIYMAREFICDPDFANKVRHGEPEKIRKCMRCLTCFSNCMGRGEFQCAINPESSMERENYYKLPPAEPKKVLIIGGGIAGMQAALTAADNGHKVILCEKSGELGGGILCEKDVSFKLRLHQYIEQQKAFIAERNIEVRLNCEMTPKAAELEHADVIIAAVGSEPVIPKIPGIDGINVHQAMQVYKNPDLAEGKVVILGAGFVGIELALHLLEKKGCPVEIIEMQGDINDGGNDHHKMAVNDMIHQKNLPIHFNTKAVEITDKGVKCEGPDGEVFYEADTVIHAVGMKAKSDLALSFEKCAPQFEIIGDCKQASTIQNATATGYAAARFIGRFPKL